MLNRRDFLKTIAGTGLALGFPSSVSTYRGLVSDFHEYRTELKIIEEPAHLLSDGKFFYLLGNLEDDDFVKTREFILSTDSFYLWSIAVTSSDTLPFKPASKESVILLPGDISSHNCDTLIRDLRLLLHPGQFIGIDYSDIRTVLGGMVARHLFVEGDRGSFGRSLSDLVSKNKRFFERCNWLLMIFSGRLDCMNLRAIDEHKTLISASIASDAKIVYTASFFETWKEEYAVSLIMN